MRELLRPLPVYALLEGRDADAVHGIHEALALEAVREGAGWVRTVARYHVPEERRESFLRANRVNRALLEAERAAGMSR
jgi:hypothetical protein